VEDLGIDGRLVLELILDKEGGMVVTRFIRLGMGTNGGLL
jgi:hypothetical protein